MAGASVCVRQALRGPAFMGPRGAKQGSWEVELKGFLGVVWVILFFNVRKTEAWRGNVAGLGCSREGQVCAAQYTIFFQSDLLCDPCKPTRLHGFHGFKEASITAVDETTERRQ